MRNHSQRRSQRAACGGGWSAPSRPQPGRRQEPGEEERLEQHAVGLVGREVACRGDEGEEREAADGDRRTRPEVERQREAGGDADHDQRRERGVAAAEPEQRRHRPDPLHRPERLARRHQQVGGGEDTARSDQAVDLEGERADGREQDQPQPAQEEPARPREGAAEPARPASHEAVRPPGGT